MPGAAVGFAPDFSAPACDATAGPGPLRRRAGVDDDEVRLADVVHVNGVEETSRKQTVLVPAFAFCPTRQQDRHVGDGYSPKRQAPDPPVLRAARSEAVRNQEPPLRPVDAKTGSHDAVQEENRQWHARIEQESGETSGGGAFDVPEIVAEFPFFDRQPLSRQAEVQIVGPIEQDPAPAVVEQVAETAEKVLPRTPRIERCGE